MTPKRKTWWLALEFFGATALRLLPDTRAVNAFLSKLYYWAYNGRKFPDLANPLRFNEKLISLKLSDEARAPLRRLITDKELVKTYVSRILGPGRVVPTYCVLKTPGDVDGFDFPARCVVKPTHSSKEVMEVRDAPPTAEERRRLKYWMWKDYFPANREPNYAGLERKLIVEPVLGDALGAIEDIKIFCFHGRPKIVQVDYDRFTGHKRDFFDVYGRRLPISMAKAVTDQPFPHPDKLRALVDYAARLSAEFSFIRVDFYVVGSDILVGELTSFPTNCTVPFSPSAADVAIGRLFDEPDLDVTPAFFGAAEPALAAEAAGAAHG